MPPRTRIDKRGQLIAKDLEPLTTMEEAQKTVLKKAHQDANGNISRTARIVSWSRTKVLKKLKEWKLYDMFPHDPGPFMKDS